MTPEQEKHCGENSGTFRQMYASKYAAGQKKHGGNMWEMGAYQALDNMRDEVLDSWSYCRQVRRTLDEVCDWIDRYKKGVEAMYLQDLENIIKREKKDD